MRLPGWNRDLSWTHLTAFVVFVLINQALAAQVDVHRARALAQPWAQPAPSPGSNLRQRLTDQAQRAHVPLRWLARDPNTTVPALAPPRALTGPLGQTLHQTIADERLSADALHRPLPEVEACFEGSVVVVRDVDLGRPCDPGTPSQPV